MRRPVISAPRIALDWLERITSEKGQTISIDLRYPEGEWAGGGEPLFYVTGSFALLVELETLILQKLGPACVAAFNTFSMCSDLPKVAFLAMDARHDAGTEMVELMGYGASVGSERARRETGAVGFVGSSTDSTAAFFGRKAGMGTMPHALIGYAGSTLKAADLFHQTLPDIPMTVLVDYFGREISDSLEVARAFPNLVQSGSLTVRIDTPESRYIEGLDPVASYALLDSHAPETIRGYRSSQELAHLVGPGTTAAAVYALREALDKAGFEKVKIAASSGFTPPKCQLFAKARAPVDLIGTGSYLPSRWSETYATADIVEYSGEERVKLGREFLLRSRQARAPKSEAE